MTLKNITNTDLTNNYKTTPLGPLPQDWEVVSFGKKEYFEIIKSGISKFRGKKSYLSTESIQGSKIQKIECKITYEKRPSRANMQPVLKSVWFAKMKKTLKVYSFNYKNQNEIEKFILSTGFCGIYCKEQVYPEYLKMFVMSEYFNSVKDNLAHGSTQQAVNNEDIKNFLLPLPPLPEQRKIAYVLSVIQEAEEKTQRYINALKEFKKSIMKHLFTYGAVAFEETDKVELKETEIGWVPKGWEIVKLGEIGNVKYGKANPKDSGLIPVVGSGGIFSTTKVPLVKNPTIVIGRKGTAGKVWLFLNPCYPSDTTFYLEWKREIEIKFIFNYLVLHPLSGEHAKTTLPSVQKPDIENLLIPLPPLPEQQRIAQILSNIDSAIEAMENKKNAIKELFQSMLKNLMTAKIRVNNLEVNI